MVVPSDILLPAGPSANDSGLEFWASFADEIVRSRLDHDSGIVMDLVSAAGPVLYDDDPSSDTSQSDAEVHGAFAFVFANRGYLRHLNPIVCRLSGGGQVVQVLTPFLDQAQTLRDCGVQLVHIQEASSVDEMGTALSQYHALLTALDFVLKRYTGLGIVTVKIPSTNLPFCDWLGSLSLEEWRNWHKPQNEMTVITNDRLESLTRLLKSSNDAIYFGDLVNMRINLEQASDLQTLRVVQSYQWKHGALSVHKRVLHGGLLPAVVESWYPHSDDSYAVILEDDVELSPMFYAWIKMGLLRYRWGAIYFPEHWREFHDYLSIRLSGQLPDLPVDAVVAPGVRSSKWTRSWKKYLIEFAYLRGYVMLYPNYAGFVSLSTNHLEVGSHVKDMPLEAYLQKRRLFLLPLMPLPTWNPR
ncbi:hypothetical protein K474DRAFT_1704236 [Panus rudis PR-1116 ss-1]|nr:hypothetical protein K474DRAFT_1704236 [Panus rudis PR-1116 ss-1]